MRRWPSALAGAGLLGVFIGVERRLRQSDAARSLDAGEEDRGTTRAVAASFGSALLTGPLLARWHRGRLRAATGWMGIAVMAGGLTLRVASARALGAHYTRTLRTEPEQSVVTEGPYRYVRHPGYAGVLLMWLGFGLALTSVPAIVATTAPNLLAYLGRIEAEDSMLSEALGDPYRAYRQRTRRLVPGLY